MKPPGVGGFRSRPKLSTQAEASDQGAVALDVIVLDVSKQALAAADELHEATAGVVVTFVNFEVLGEPVDTACEQGNLHFRRAGVGLVQAVFGDRLCLCWHLGPQI